MRALLFPLAVAFALAGAGCLSQSAEGQRSVPAPVEALPGRVPVVVELFTSEGCSSCPPADRALRFLAEQQPVANAQVIPLAFHVDYWNYLGWRDKFSSPEYSLRQEHYVSRFGLRSSYTPEMVVDGAAEFVGSDTGRATKAIADAALRQKAEVSTVVEGNIIHVNVSKLGDHDRATVFLAVTEDGITSDVKSGENGGQTFIHSAVVRSLTALGVIEKDAAFLDIDSQLPVIAEADRSNTRYVVFVQDNKSRRILAAGIAGVQKPVN